MFVVLWEFEVKSVCKNRFETVYGPSGDWAHLFRMDASYIETRLMRDTSRSQLYVTLDFWTSRETYENFLQEHSNDYKSLDTACEGLTISERRIGTCEEIM